MGDCRLSDLDVVAFCDPAGGKKAGQIKRVRARAAIAVVGMDFLERFFLLYVWAARATTDKLVEQIFFVQQHYLPRLFGVEANAMQTLFANALRREARFKLEHLPIVEVTQPSGIEKPFRNRTALQPVINEGRWLMQIDQVEAKNELATHPMNPLCDIVDACASAVKLLPRQPKQVVRRDEVIRLAAYLRRTGAPPWYISQRVTELENRLAAREGHSPRPDVGGGDGATVIVDD